MLIVGAAMGGRRVGRRFRTKKETGRETFGVAEVLIVEIIGAGN